MNCKRELFVAIKAFVWLYSLTEKDSMTCLFELSTVVAKGHNELTLRRNYVIFYTVLRSTLQK